MCTCPWHLFSTPLVLYGVAGRTASPVGVVAVDCVRMPVWLEPPLETSRMTVAASASTTSRTATLNPTASAVESRRGGDGIGTGNHWGGGQNEGGCGAGAGGGVPALAGICCGAGAG